MTGGCTEVLLIRALQGHGFDWIEPFRLHKVVTHDREDNFQHLVHGTNWYALDNILFDDLKPGGGNLPSAVQPGGEGSSLAVRVDNHFAAFPPWSSECIAGMRKESEVHIFYDIPRLMSLGVEFMVSVNGAT